MIIFKKQYEKARIGTAGIDSDEGLKALLDEAKALVNRAGQGVKGERSPVTMIEKIQISDTTKLVQKLIMDIDRDVKKGRPYDKDREKLETAVSALRTSIENILD
ncbi:MAG: hypothetical protein IKS84_01785 [Lachnospiraceae bacterium]|nr:hypothetical protein [Lachnospiraceae bacterium]MBR6486320.1 hypothetical protein [Lachnospiraceae bacterium]